MDIIQKIHAHPGKFVMAIVGGGTSAISRLLAIPGGSNTLLEAIVPYYQQSLYEFLSYTPPNACSDATARAMAMQAYLKGKALNVQDEIYGLGASVAIATNRLRHGQDKGYIALQSSQRTLALKLTLEQSASRLRQEQICSDTIIELMAYGLDLIEAPVTACHQVHSTTPPQSWQELFNGQRQTTWQTSPPRAILPGSFNPPHQGHYKMQQMASKILGAPVIFELSIFNVDKPPLDYLEIVMRTQQLQPYDYMLTNTPTFTEKTKLFPGTTFVVGIDTISRIAANKYYHQSGKKALRAFQQFKQNGNRFLVFGRLLSGRFGTLRDLAIPKPLLELCTEVPESQYRVDISSTELRSAIACRDDQLYNGC